MILWHVNAQLVKNLQCNTKSGPPYFATIHYFFNIILLSFLGQILNSSQTLFHYCLPFPSFLGQVIHLFKFDLIPKYKQT
jgi:hypothetical protein